MNRLLIVSNRLPISVTKKRDKLQFEPSIGGLATAEGVIPGLSKHILVKEIATPLIYERYTLNTEGASAGWSRNPRYALTKGYASPVRSLRTPINNLLAAGHWSFSPGGLPSAMLTGKAVADTIKGQ